MAGYERRIDDPRDLGIEVIAGSVDPPLKAAETVERLSLSFPVLHGLDLEDIAERFAVHTHEDGYFQPAGFLLRDGAIEQATWSTGPLGRLRAGEVIDWVEHAEKKD